MERVDLTSATSVLHMSLERDAKNYYIITWRNKEDDFTGRGNCLSDKEARRSGTAMGRGVHSAPPRRLQYACLRGT